MNALTKVDDEASVTVIRSAVVGWFVKPQYQFLFGMLLNFSLLVSMPRNRKRSHIEDLNTTKVTFTTSVMVLAVVVVVIGGFCSC